MNKGFTLVELLAVVVILAVIGGVGIISYTSITKKTEGDYYINLIDNLELSATNYFADNRSKRPAINEICSSVTLETLIDEHYVESADDHNGNSCDLKKSRVYIKRNNDKQYEYKTYLDCEGDNYDVKFNQNDYCIN